MGKIDSTSTLFTHINIRVIFYNTAGKIGTILHFSARQNKVSSENFAFLLRIIINFPCLFILGIFASPLTR